MRLPECSRAMGVAVVLLGFVFNAGCVGTKPFGPLPQTDEEFQFSPRDIVKKYPEIKTYQEEYLRGGNKWPTVDELIQKWGPPARTRTDSDWTRKVIGGAELTGLGLWFTGGTALVAVPLGAWGFYSASATETVMTWEKQNYRIDVVSGGRRKQQVVYWDWKYLEAAQPQPVFNHKGKIVPLTRFDFGFLAQFGRQFHPSDLGFNRGGQLGVGLGVDGWITHWDSQITVSLSSRENYRHSSGHQIVLQSIPIELSMHRSITSKWRIGGGVDYHPAGNFLSNYALEENVENAIGAVIQADYAINKRSRVGLRFERLRFRTESGVV